MEGPSPATLCWRALDGNPKAQGADVKRGKDRRQAKVGMDFKRDMAHIREDVSKNGADQRA